MAGIGFNLQKILAGDTYFDSAKAHLYSVLISAGPWVLSIITLFCLSLFAPENIDTFELVYFRTSIIYIYAFSLIGAGLVQLVLTRYLADKLYLKEKEALVPAFNSSTVVLLAVQGISGGLYVFFGDEAFSLRLLVFLIYLTVSMIWLVMTLLSALYDYKAIVFIYAIGSVLTVAGSWGLGSRMGLAGYFLGYLIGHLLIMILLSARIFIEFSSDRKFDWEFLRFLSRNWTLVLIGAVYNLAIWIDKIVFWFSPDAIEVSRLLRAYPAYESAVFFAYLTIIPSLSFFLLEIETSFYKSYRAFFLEILEKGSYPGIEKRKQEIQKTLSRSIGFLVKYQGLISLLFITFIPNLAQFAGMQWIQVPVFRVATVGAFLHSLLLIVMILALYFDFKPLTLRICLVFLITNGLFAFITGKLPAPFLGYGYLASCFVSLVFAFYVLDFRLKKLEYITFSSQPVGIHREEEVW